MEKYLIGLLFLAGVAVAEPTEETPKESPTAFPMFMRVLCSEDADYIFDKVRGYDEDPILVTKQPDDTGSISVWLNRDTGSLSIVTVNYATKIACLVAAGKETAYKKDFFVPKGIEL